MKRLSAPSLALVLSIGATSLAHAATMQFDHYVGISNIADPDIACTAPVTPPVGGQGAMNYCNAAVSLQASPAPGIGFFFPRFDTSYGTLKRVRLQYNLNTGGVWIGRPEDSFFSLSTDFNFSSSVTLFSDHFGNQDTVSQRYSTWDPADYYGLSVLEAEDIIDGAGQVGSYNARVDQQTWSWSASLSGLKEVAPGAAFLYTPGVNPAEERVNIQLILAYDLYASLSGRGADCGGLVDDACGVTNRITSLTNAKFSLIYDYDPPAPVPVPGAVWLFGSGLVGLLGVGRLKSRRSFPGQNKVRR